MTQNANNEGSVETSHSVCEVDVIMKGTLTHDLPDLRGPFILLIKCQEQKAIDIETQITGNSITLT